MVNFVRVRTFKRQLSRRTVLTFDLKLPRNVEERSLLFEV